MLTRIAIAWVVLAACFGFVLGGSLVWSQQPPPNYKGEPRAANTTKGPISGPLADSSAAPDKSNGKKEKAWYSTFSEHAPEWLIAVFTATLWWTTRRLWRATRDELKLAREEFLSTHRPAIRVKHVWLMTKLVYDDEPIIVRVVYVNSGTTVAEVYQYAASIIIADKDEPLPPDIKHNEITFPPLFLKPGISLPLPDFEKVLDYWNAKSITEGKAILYCIGFLRYKDGAGEIRTTAFCRRFKVAAHPFRDRGRFERTDPPDRDYEYQD